MIPEFVFTMGATMVVDMSLAAPGAAAAVCLTPDTLLNAVKILDREKYLLEDVTALIASLLAVLAPLLLVVVVLIAVWRGRRWWRRPPGAPPRSPSRPASPCRPRNMK